MTALNSLPVQPLTACGMASYGLNLHRTLNLAESSGLRIITILLLLLLYLFTVLQFSHTGAIVEDGEQVDCEVRFLEGWAVGKIAVFPESLAWPCASPYQ